VVSFSISVIFLASLKRLCALLGLKGFSPSKQQRQLTESASLTDELMP
jgi:hypothetical protein